MEEWHCFKCKEKVEVKPIFMSYLEMTLSITGLECPKCGVRYLTEKIVVENVNKGEKMLEDKPS